MIADYLEAAWGESVDNPTYADVLSFIEKTKGSDEEHRAFWVGMEDEMVLEVHQDLTVILLTQLIQRAKKLARKPKIGKRSSHTTSCF